MKENPDASISSDSELEDGAMMQNEQNEVDLILQEQNQDLDESDLEIEEEVSESEEDDKKEIFGQLDGKFKQMIGQLSEGLQYQSKEIQNYKLTNILAYLFYFYQRKTKEDNIDHPIIKYINIFENNKEVLEQVQDVIKQQIDMNQENIIKEKEQIKEDQKIDFQKQQEDQYKPRLITKRMQRNKGVPKSKCYSKGIKNPRLKQKKKYRNALETLVSKGHKRVKKIKKVYEGEENGIRIGVDRTIDIN